MQFTATFYNDPGFTEGCVEVPSYNNLELDDEDGTTYENIHPSRDRIFEQVRIPEYYFNARSYCYIKLTIVNNTKEGPQQSVYYGWVDKVSVASDNEENPMVDVSWHIDLWRTWMGLAQFGYGMVTNKPFISVGNMNYPIQKVPYAYKRYNGSYKKFFEPDTTEVLGHTSYVFWIVISYVRESNENKNTQVVYTFYPFLIDARTGRLEASENIYLNASYEQEELTASLGTFKELATGQVLQNIGISVTSVSGAWVVPKFPLPYTLKKSQPTLGFKFYFNGENQPNRGSYNGRSYYYLEYGYNFDSEDVNLNAEYASTEDNEICLLDGMGEKIWSIPQHFTVDNMRYRLVVSPTTCYYDIFFKRGGFGTDEQAESQAKQNGCFTQMNLPTFPFASNSWSDYVISGQKEAIREQRNIQLGQQFIGNLTGAGTSGMQGAGMGAITGHSMAGMGMLGLGVGMAQAGAGIIAGAYFNDKLNKLSDTVSAKQIDTLAIDGGSTDWFKITKGCARLTSVTLDAYSSEMWTRQRQLNGYEVSEPTANCTSICHGTGPVAISNLIVRGEIPAEAKQYIKQKFNDGVRLI